MARKINYYPVILLELEMPLMALFANSKTKFVSEIIPQKLKPLRQD